MAYVFCNSCGHRNPPDSSFCSSCGSALDIQGDRTVTLTAVDPLQDAPGGDDDVVVCSESRQGARIRFVHVRRSLATGKVLDETPYPGNLAHQPPAPPPLRVSRMWGWGTGVRGRWMRRRVRRASPAVPAPIRHWRPWP